MMCVRMEIPTLWRRGVGLSSDARGSESRLTAYVETLIAVLGHADRGAPFRSYCAGLLLPGARKSVEPMAARVAPGRVQAAHQSLNHFVAKADWSDEALLAAVRAQVLPVMQRAGPIRGWMVMTRASPRRDRIRSALRGKIAASGKQDNCQVAVTLSLAGDYASLPLAHRPYLPQSWAEDAARRAKPVFQTTWVSRPSRNWHSHKSARRSRPACRSLRCWPMPDMASTARSETVSQVSDWVMRSGV